MPPPGGSFQDPGNQQDLFAVAPSPAETVSSAATPEDVPDSDPSLLPPVAGPERSGAPLLTNEQQAGQSGAKPPLVFSDGHPLPSRDGGRDLAPAREKSFAAPAHRGTVHLSPGDFDPDVSFGDLLAHARKEAGLSEEQVRQITKLNAGYLSALEHSDMKNLPPPVYVTAYIRTLSELYGLDEESAALVREKLNAGPRIGDVPSALIQSLEKDGVINEKEDKRIRKIFWCSVAALVLLLLLIVGSIVMVLWPRTEDGGETPLPGSAAAESRPAAMEEPAGKPEFSRADFDALTMPQVPEASTLQMSRKRAVVPQ